MLEQGTKAPDFTLMNQQGQSVSLSDFRGQRAHPPGRREGHHEGI